MQNSSPVRQCVIHCVGDSHVSLFSGYNAMPPEWPDEAQVKYPFFKVYRLGAVTAYNLCEKSSSTGSQEKLWQVIQSRTTEHDYVLLSFGEIDCRAHLLKHAALQGRQPSELVRECVDRYSNVILAIRRSRPSLIIYNAIPSSSSDLIPHSEFPSFGNCKERNLVTREFNDCLAAFCIDNRIHFLSNFSLFVDKDLKTLSRYYMDDVHLSQKALRPTIRAMAHVLEAPWLKIAWYHGLGKNTRLQ